MMLSQPRCAWWQERTERGDWLVSSHTDFYNDWAISTLSTLLASGWPDIPIFEIWSKNEGTASVFLNSRWRQPPCWILATGRFSTPRMSFNQSQHFCQIWYIFVKQWRNTISFSKFKMTTAAMLDSGHQAFFDSIHLLSFKVSSFLPNLVKIGLKLWEQYQFQSFLQIRDTFVFTDKGFYR